MGSGCLAVWRPLLLSHYPHESLQGLAQGLPTMWRKERQNGAKLFSETPGVAMSREDCGQAMATFDLKQHFQEKGLESAPCSAQATWARSWELLISWLLPVPSTGLPHIALDPKLLPPHTCPCPSRSPTSLVLSCQWCLLPSLLWACPALQCGAPQPWCLLSP